MMLLMDRGPSGHGSETFVGATLAVALESMERNAVRGPVGHEDLADDVLARNRSPEARVARLRAVVAHHEVLALRHREDSPVRGVRRRRRAARRFDVRLVQLATVDEDVAVAPDQSDLEPIAG